MYIESKLIKNSLYIYPLVDIDERYASFIRREIDNLIETNSFTKLIFDFKNINFMDSTGIGMILGRYKKLHKQNIAVSVKNANSQIDKVLRASGMYELFLCD